jgi:hypothetical protein
MHPTTVINIRDAPDGWQGDELYVYVGRQNPRYGLKRSDFANPFIIGRDGVVDRDDAMSRFRCQIKNAPAEFIDRIKTELSGRILVCWCKPLDCHADIYAAICNGEEW